MKKRFVDALQVRLGQFLEDCDEVDADHELVHPGLADQMAAAAALVYDSAQAAQRFEKSQRSE